MNIIFIGYKYNTIPIHGYAFTSHSISTHSLSHFFFQTETEKLDYPIMNSPLFPFHRSFILFLNLLPLFHTFINCHIPIPTTLEGPFLPVTVPFDPSLRGDTVDLPDTDPRVRRQVIGFEPEQISLSLSTTHDSVWISWITGMN
jgi:hypothetical protein